ncbi:MAG: metallophosphoesterase family protein [Eubacteriales bacterium]|nr:metallophosphoesterase family protein [Eubacteriales bacterium]
MKILTVSDEICAALYDYYVPGRLKEYDLIISCGDLNPKYLSFLVTMARCPVIYIHGNHDGRYEKTPPEGCDCIDEELVVFNGVRILGLGGCRKYRPGPHQYTEEEMKKRIARLRRSIRRLGGVDIIVTHAPPAGLGDADDPAHWGFQCLVDLVDELKPKYLVHGHVHMAYGHNIPREIPYKDTTVVNACERYTIEVPEGKTDMKHYGQVVYKTTLKQWLKK